jgi:hypothetical protein
VLAGARDGLCAAHPAVSAKPPAPVSGGASGEVIEAVAVHTQPGLAAQFGNATVMQFAHAE